MSAPQEISWNSAPIQTAVPSLGGSQGPGIGEGGGGQDSGGYDGGRDDYDGPGEGYYQMGGYTGMGRNGMIEPAKPAGTVHEGEFVVSAPAVNRIGLGNLEKLHKRNRMPDNGQALARVMIGGRM